MSATTMLSLHVDGRLVSVPAGSNVAAAVAQLAPLRFRDAVHGAPRAPLCGMGVCFECRVCIDGRGQLRACVVPARNGMRVSTRD